MNRVASSLLTSAGAIVGAMLGAEVGDNHFKSRWSKDASLLVGGLLGGVAVGSLTSDPTPKTSGAVSGTPPIPRFP